MSAASSNQAPNALPGWITIALTDVCDWEEPVREAAAIAAATGRRLRVVLADNGELMTAASLDCARMLATWGHVSSFDQAAARRLLKAQAADLRQGLQRLAARLGIEIGLVEPASVAAGGFWAGSTALTLIGRRRRGTILVIHAGTTATLEVAARLARERRQMVRLLSAAPADEPGAAALRRLFGPWLHDAPEPWDETTGLPRAQGVSVTALVIDPAWLERSRLTLTALREQWLRLRTMS